MGCFIYCLMGTSKDITMGPTAIMSILTAEYALDRWTHYGDGEERVSWLIMVSEVFGAVIYVEPLILFASCQT